jgi:sec-independent protein translocase protein TatA
MELLLILVIVLIIFGAGKLPQLGEGIGKAIKGFKKSAYEPEPVEHASLAQTEPSPTQLQGPETSTPQGSLPSGSSQGASQESTQRQESAPESKQK